MTNELDRLHVLPRDKAYEVREPDAEFTREERPGSQVLELMTWRTAIDTERLEMEGSVG